MVLSDCHDRHSRIAAILCEQIRVIDKSRINKIIGHLEEDYLVKLEQALLVILGININKI